MILFGFGMSYEAAEEFILYSTSRLVPEETHEKVLVCDIGIDFDIASPGG